MITYDELRGSLNHLDAVENAFAQQLIQATEEGLMPYRIARELNITQHRVERFMLNEYARQAEIRKRMGL